VALALLGVSQAYAHTEDPPTTRYVVARQAIAPGTTLDPAVLELAPAELAEPTAGRAFRDRGVLEGAITLAPLAAGELVQLGQVLPAATAAVDGVELSFAVAADRALGGAVQPGESVDLVATFATGDPGVVAERAVITAVTSEGDGLLDTAGPVVLTVRLQDRDELLDVVRAVDEGQVTVARPGGGGLSR
jgi:Flp pilus assembly protein CpaB